MKRVTKILIILTVLLLCLGIAGIVYAVRARLVSNEYQFQVDAVLAAASVANGGEVSTDPLKAVWTEYAGRQAIVAPGNYKALSYYLRSDAMMPPFGRIREEKCLKITVCDEAVFWVMPLSESGDSILIRLTTQGQTFLMRARGGNLWPNLLECALNGTYRDRNIVPGEENRGTAD